MKAPKDLTGKFCLLNVLVGHFVIGLVCEVIERHTLSPGVKGVVDFLKHIHFFIELGYDLVPGRELCLVDICTSS